MGEPCMSIARAIGVELVERETPAEDLRREVVELRRLLDPTFMLMADIAGALDETPPAMWAAAIRKMRQDSLRYSRLVNRLLSGELSVRGVHFIRLEDDMITRAEFDAELDSD